MKPFLVLACLLAAVTNGRVALAGPSDGGGTNLTEDQLTDFVKFEKEEGFGVKQYALNPQKLKLKDGSVPFAAAKPLLDRLHYFYPGIGDVLNDTFDKDWLLLDATFNARKPGEKKGISQTSDVVYVSLPWIKNAKPELVRQALVHEAIRNLANAVIGRIETRMRKKISDPAVKLALADEFTETLTPVVYQALPAKQLNQTMNEAFRKITAGTYKALGDNEEPESNFVLPASRERIYRDLPTAQIKTLITKMCVGIDDKTQDTDGLREKISNRLTGIRKTRHDYFQDDIGPWFEYGGGFAAENFDENLQALFKFLDDVQMRDGDDAEFILYRDCQALSGVQFPILDEFKKDKGKVQDPLGDRQLDHLPPDDDTGGEATKAQ